MSLTPLPAGSLRATSLNAVRRSAELARLADRVVDLLVVGGGVTGAGVALDAASRGLSVALVEAGDLASGTSRYSSKLVHGGLRYLASGEYRLAHESAVERGLLMRRTAPHLVRALPQLVPLYPDTSTRKAAWFAAGQLTGDLLRRVARTSSDLLPPPRRTSAAETMALVPGLRRTGLRGGQLWFDGQLSDDAALVVALARTAAGFGASVLTRVRARHLDGDGADAVDTLTGERLRIRARSVVNAAGVWAAQLADGVRLQPSLGSHVVLAASAMGLSATGLGIPIPGQRNRFALVLPQLDGRAYVGLTDEPLDGPLPAAGVALAAPQADVDALLSVASSVMARPLTRADVLGTYAGLRPLLAGAAGRSADLSRRHAVLTAPDGVVTVVGGKLTTYRRMAADAVDAAAVRLAASGIAAGPSRTRAVPLVGAASRLALDELAAPPRLVARYGTDALRITAFTELEPELGEPIAAGLPVTGAEVLWAVRHEGALNADDVLDRRTTLGLVPADRLAAEAAVTAVVGRAMAELPTG